MGSRKFYDLMDNNTSFLYGSVGFTNAVPVIMAQHRMTSINSAIEIDLCGQVCSDTIGSKFFSGKAMLCSYLQLNLGFGGQTDFVYGSAAALDGQGKSILALPARTEKGEPKIVPFLVVLKNFSTNFSKFLERRCGRSLDQSSRSLHCHGVWNCQSMG